MKYKITIFTTAIIVGIINTACNNGSSSNPTPTPTITPSPSPTISPTPYIAAKYAYIANSSINASLYLCDINIDNGNFNNCELQLDQNIPIVYNITSGNNVLYISYHSSPNIEGIYSYLVESSGSINRSSLVNNTVIDTYYHYQDYISTFNNIIYVINDSATGNYDISNCSLNAPNWLTVSSCSRFNNNLVNLYGVRIRGNIAFNQNGYAYFITYHNDYKGEYNQIAQCQVSNRSGALINCSFNTTFNYTYYLNAISVTNNYAYIFNYSEKSINTCQIENNGIIGTCQKQFPLNSSGQNMMGNTAISPIVRNNRLFFMNSSADITNSAVVSCPIGDSGLIGTCNASASYSQFSSPQALTML